MDERKQLSVTQRLITAAVIVFLCIVFVAPNWSFLIDDAFISLRFALNVAEGHGWVFNRGEAPVEGFTNFLWTLLLAIVIGSGGDPLLWAKVFGLAALIALALLSWRVAGRLAPGSGLFAAVAGLLIAGNAHLAMAAMAGLETVSFVLLILTAIWLSTEWRRGVLFMATLALVALLALLSRPDAVVWLAAPVGYRLWMEFRRRRGRAAAIVAIGILGGGIVAFGLWKIATFGSLIPQTFFAKQELVGDQGRGRAIEYLVAFGFSQTTTLLSLGWMNLWLLVAVAGVGVGAKSVLHVNRVARLRNQRLFFCYFLPIIFSIIYIYFVNADWMPGFRFLIPTFALICVLIPWSARMLTREWNPSRGLLRGVIACLALFALAEQSRLDTVYVFGRGQVVRQERSLAFLNPAETVRLFREPFVGPLDVVSGELLRRVGDGQRILMSDIGQVSWYLPGVRIRDLDALVSPDLSRSRMADGGDYRIAKHLLEEERVEWLLLFRTGMTPRLDDPSGHFYPMLSRAVARLDSFEFYTPVWMAPKGPEIWNLLFHRPEVPPDVLPMERQDRIELLIHRSPRLAHPRWLIVQAALEEWEDVHDAAWQALLGFLRRSSDAGFALMVAEGLGELEREDLAAQALEASLRRQPNARLLRWRLLNAYRALGEQDAAARLLRDSLRLDTPRDMLFHTALMDQREDERDWEGMLTIALMILDLSPSAPVAWESAGVAINQMLAEESVPMTLASSLEKLQYVYTTQFGERSPALTGFQARLDQRP